MSAASAASTTTAAEEPYAKRWVLLVALCLCAFITGLDNTVLNIALPKLQESLHLSLSGLQWVGTSYILAFSSLLLVGGRLTDLFGRRTILLSGMVIFTTASVFAGLAPNGTLLIVARVLQGVGGAFVLPATAGVLSYDVEPDYRHTAVGVWTASIASSIALGPIVGGAIVEVAHWSWIFFINLPIGVAAVVMIRKTVPPASIERPVGPELVRRLDIPALVYSSLSLLAFTFLLVHGQEHGFLSALIIGAVIFGVVTAALFIRNERRSEFPLVDLNLFRNRIFSGGVVAQTIWGLGINGILFFTSLFLQDILKLEPFKAGLCFVPLAVAVGITVPIGAKMATKWGVNVTVAIGMVLIAIGLLMGVFVQADSSPLRFLAGLIVVGLGSGLTTPMTAAVIEVVPHEQAGIGSAVVSTAREISGVLGIVAIGAVLVVRRQHAIDAGFTTSDAFVSGYHLALIVATFVMLIGAVVSQFTLTTKDEAIEIRALRAAEEAAANAKSGPGAIDAADLPEATTPLDLGVAAAAALHEEQIVHEQHAHPPGNGDANGSALADPPATTHRSS